jgi:hypothetical protein
MPQMLNLIGFALWVPVAMVSAQYGAVRLPDGLSPRYYMGTSPELHQRQTGLCAVGSHSCKKSNCELQAFLLNSVTGLDVNSSSCCPDSQYCIIGLDLTAQCCDLGSNCGITACAASQYLCETPTTISGTATVASACCGRSCPISTAFKCPHADGGGCCSYGSSCGPGGSCLSSATPAASSNNAVVSEVPSGCTTSQIACASSLGGGCCGVSSACNVIDNSYFCVAATQTAARTGVNGYLASGALETSNSGGLSPGAKAGIGAGIAALFIVVASVLLWFCCIHRRNARNSTLATSVPATSQVSGSGTPKPRANLVRQQTAADYFGPLATAGEDNGARKALSLIIQHSQDIVLRSLSRRHSNSSYYFTLPE